MSHRSFALGFRVKAIVSILLLVVTPIVQTGCGIGLQPTEASAAQGEHLLQLTPDNAISITLQNTNFAGATALAVNPQTHTFRFAHPDSSLILNGQLALDGEKLYISELVIGNSHRQARMMFDTARHITAMTTSDGYYWVRPADWTSNVDPNSADDLEGFLTANRELVEIAGAVTGAAAGGGNGNGAGAAVDLVGTKILSQAQAAALAIIIPLIVALYVGIGSVFFLPIGLPLVLAAGAIGGILLLAIAIPVVIVASLAAAGLLVAGIVAALLLPPLLIGAAIIAPVVIGPIALFTPVVFGPVAGLTAFITSLAALVAS